MLGASDLTARWESLFEGTGTRRTILRVAEAYPEERSVTLAFPTVDRFDSALADSLLAHPEETLRAGEAALRRALPETLHLAGEIRLRIEDLPGSQRVGIRNIRQGQLNRFFSVEGIVRRVSQVVPQVVEAVFECAACAQKVRWPQDRVDPVLRPPTECPESQGGCGKPASKTRFTLLEGESRTVDHQRLELQENPEGLRGGTQPAGLTVVLSEDLVGRVVPGARLVICGTLRGLSHPAPNRGGALATVLDQVFLANSVERKSVEYTEIEISSREEAAIEHWRGDPKVFPKIVQSIAPSIKEMDPEKEAIALQFFGGVAKNLADGTRLRGDIHILMVGDPGVAKSQLLRYVAETAPRGVYTSGKGASAAGLTAAAVKDELAGGRWMLEAGAMVLADGGQLVIDEFDKMGEGDRSSLHEALEQGTVSISKAGITVTLRARCPVLAASNPKLGRFTQDQEPQQQINLPPTLLSRFDVILVIQDRPDEVKDRRLAGAILRQHARAEVVEAGRQGTEGTPEGLAPGTFSQDFLRKYIAYAKKHISPEMDESARQRLEDYYMEMRRMAMPKAEGEPPKAIPITPRQLEALVRLTEAAARARLSRQATREDAEVAVRVIDYFLRKVTATESGQLDIDFLTTGVSSNRRDRIHRLRELLRGLQATHPQGFTLAQVLEEARRQLNMDPKTVEGILDELTRMNDLFSPQTGLLKLVG